MAFKQISRRRFLRTAGLVLGSGSLVNSHAWGRQTTAFAPRSFPLVKEFERVILKAVSPDSRRICIAIPGKSVSAAGARSNAERPTILEDSPITIAIVEIGSWKHIYSAPVPFESRFSFFPDGDRLYGRTTLKATREGTQMEFLVIDLRTGKTEKRQEKFNSKTTFYGGALRDNMLIGTRGGRLVKVEWPSFRELAAVETRD
jgi:hypothetical protein